MAVNNTFTQADIDDNKLTYTPNGDAEGDDSFGFEVSDGAGGSTGNKTFSITINPSNDAPIASDNSFTTPEDTAIVNKDGTIIFLFRNGKEVNAR
jgi:hypothetical protein